MARLSARFAGWVPIRVFRDARGLRVDWCHFGPTRFTDSFFRGDVDVALRHPFNLAFRQETPIETLVELASERPGIAPTAFIHHASRCGSTLIARMLMALPTHVVISEPTMLAAILRADMHDPGIDPELKALWLRSLFAALAQPRAGDESRFVVKFDAWNVVDLPLLRRAFPDVPWIFVYRDPVEIASSQMRAPGAHMVPGLLGASVLVSVDEARGRSREEFIARVIGRILEAGAANCADGGGRPVNYEELPDAVLHTLAPLLGISPDAATTAALAEVTAMDAKTPQLPFADDRERKRREATPALVAAVERHARAPYRALERLRTSGEAHDSRAQPRPVSAAALR